MEKLIYNPYQELSSIQKNFVDLYYESENLSDRAFNLYCNRHIDINKISIEIRDNKAALPEMDFNKYCEELQNVFGKSFGNFSHWIATNKKYWLNEPGDVLPLSEELINNKSANFNKAESGILIMASIFELQLRSTGKIREVGGKFENRLVAPTAIFASEEAMKSCNELFEHLQITVDGICQLTQRKGYMLKAAVVAMRQTPKFFKVDWTADKFMLHFCKFLGVSFKRIKPGGKYPEVLDDAERFLRLHYKI